MTDLEVKKMDARETNYFIRKMLKDNYPGVKFRVRKSELASIHISWEDGPKKSAVNSLIDPLKSGDFDGMQDHGANSGNIFEYDGKKYISGAGYIYIYRTLSDDLQKNAWEYIRGRYALCEGIEEIDYGTPEFENIRLTLGSGMVPASVVVRDYLEGFGFWVNSKK